MAAEESNIAPKEILGRGLECLLCRKIVQQLDEFLTHPNFTDNVRVTKYFCKLSLYHSRKCRIYKLY